MFYSCCFYANAHNLSDNCYNEEDSTIFLDENSSLSISEKEQIVHFLLSKESNSNRNVLCSIFGHNFEIVDTLTVITHKVNNTAPRCLKETVNVKQCSRCEEYSSEVISSRFIDCCP